MFHYIHFLHKKKFSDRIDYMFTHFIFLHKRYCFLKATGDSARASSTESIADTWVSMIETPELIKARRQKEADDAAKKSEELLNAKKKWFVDSRSDLIEKSQKYSEIGNDRVQFLLENYPFFKKNPQMAQDMVNDYITKYAEPHKALKKSLEEQIPQPKPEEIQKALDIDDATKFTDFIQEQILLAQVKAKKLRVSQRVDVYLSLLPEDKKSEFKEKVEAFFSGGYFDYKEIRERIVRESQESWESIEKEIISKKVRNEMNNKFLEYSRDNGLPINEDSLKNLDTIGVDEGATEPNSEEIKAYTWKSILSSYNAFDEWAKEMRAKKDEYVEELARYSSTDEIQDMGSRVVSEAPTSLSSLKSGESLSFASTSSEGDTIYRVQSEGDGQYTVKFDGITIKDVPKKELDVIVSLNKIPIIESLFSVNSSLYRTILREYKLLCAQWWSDPLKNPPDWFTEFIFRRLSDSYAATNPTENEQFLIGENLSNLPYEERGRYISHRLSTDEWLKSQVRKRLSQQGIVVQGRVNLSKFPV